MSGGERGCERELGVRRVMSGVKLKCACVKLIIKDIINFQHTRESLQLDWGGIHAGLLLHTGP